jgi:hypothetical protein
LATWNERSLCRPGDLRFTINELRIKGRFFNYSLINIHALTNDSEQEAKDQFYEQLERAYADAACPSYDGNLVMGDANAKVGRETIVSCRYHLYADDVQLYISCSPSDYVNCISRLNLDLDQILQWSLRNALSINATKSQAMVVNPRLLQLDDACQISLDGNTIAFHQKVKNLGLIMNSKLTWDDQISKICRKVFFTLKRLWPMSQFTPIQTRQKLVTSLIVPQFLYCDVIFSQSSLSQDCVNASNSPLIHAPDTYMVFPVMSTYRPTPTESWAFHWTCTTA